MNKERKWLLECETNEFCTKTVHSSTWVKSR